MASNPRLTAPIIMSARGEGSARERNKRNVCIALASGFRVRIGLRRNCGCHPTNFSPSSFKTDPNAHRSRRGRSYQCVAALARPKVYETVLAAVRERVGENPALRTSGTISGNWVNCPYLRPLCSRDRARRRRCRGAVEEPAPQYSKPRPGNRIRAFANSHLFFAKGLAGPGSASVG